MVAALPIPLSAHPTISVFNVVAAILLSASCVVWAEAPEPITDADFAELKANSPFLRSLNLSDNYVLTGVAQIAGEVVATVRDRETKEIIVVSGEANDSGWRIVGIEGDHTNPKSMTAQISSGGSGVFSIRFDQNQLKPSAPKLKIPEKYAKYIADAAKNYRRGFSGDGHRGPPPPELAEKLGKLSEETRAQLIYKVFEMRNRGVSSEERQKVFSDSVDQALRQGR